MNKDLEQSLGELIDSCYKEQVSGIELQKALEDYFRDDDTDAAVKFRNFYYESGQCDLHQVHFAVTVDWDGVTVEFLLNIIHRDFTVKVHYQTRGLEHFTARIEELQGSERALREWLQHQQTRIQSS